MDVGFNDPFEGDLPEGSRSIEDLEEQAATQEALAAEREEALSAAAAEDKPVEERTVPWSKNTTWDSDTSFVEGLHQIALQLARTDPVIGGYEALVEYGELSEEVQRRTLELSITDRVLIYAALQVLGVVSGERWRVQMDALLTKLEYLAEPTELEEAALVAAEKIAAVAYQQMLKERISDSYPDVGVYTQEEFAEEMANPNTEDEHIRRLQREQAADLN